MIKYLFNVFLRYTVVSVIPVSKKLESESFSVKHSDLYRTIILMIDRSHFWDITGTSGACVIQLR